MKEIFAILACMFVSVGVLCCCESYRLVQQVAMDARVDADHMANIFDDDSPRLAVK